MSRIKPVTRSTKNAGIPRSPVAPPREKGRLILVDALRGIAICMMIAYHFSFDLNYYGWINQDFNGSPFWLGARAVIVTLFLFTVGISLQLARRAADAKMRFWRRLGKIAGCAVLVSLGSYLMFPQSYIFFGVLHFIALASLLGWLLAGAQNWNLALAFAALALGNTVKLPLFDGAYLQWVGLGTHKPVTEDFVPLLPWFGVVAIGLFIGAKLQPNPMSALSETSPRALVWLGQNALLVYMLHQPVLLGILWAAHAVV